MMNDPLDNIKWLNVDDLEANDYNPNAVFSPELKLLERSVMNTGWVQPILISRDNIIIDGFHRWSLSRDSKKIKEKYKGKVPCAVLDVDRGEAMVLTVRMNRAKGSHIAVRMSEMIKELIDTHKYDVQHLSQELGASKKEIDLLYQDGLFKARNIKDYKYAKAWIPAESNFDDKG
jgi:ParB-like chromosome segregation protein Spo0J